MTKSKRVFFSFSSKTMTTVGYGDMYPKSLWGKLIGSVASICGVLVIALPIPIIVSHFSDYYQEQLKREKLLKQKQDRDRINKKNSNFSIHEIHTTGIDHDEPLYNSKCYQKKKSSFSVEDGRATLLT